MGIGFKLADEDEHTYRSTKVNNMGNRICGKEGCLIFWKHTFFINQGLSSSVDSKIGSSYFFYLSTGFSVLFTTFSG